MSTKAPLSINGTVIEAGRREVIKLPVGRLPSGNQISMQAHVYNSAELGPTMLVLAGVHGDEINGVEIVRRALVDGLFEEIERGAVIAIPILNLFGFINFSRDVPDGKDVNRSFPGRKNGSLASRVARTLTKLILPNIDFGVDLHTGGKAIYNYPQVRFTRGHEPSQRLAQSFGAPFLVAKTPIARSLRKVAIEADKPFIIFEGGESLRYDGFSITLALEGLKRLMIDQGLIADLISREPTRIFQKTTWVRAPKAGLFLWHKDSGQEVIKGEPLGEINNPYGNNSKKLFAPRNGFIIGHNNAPVVSQGDALFHIGYEVEVLD